ncbi:MAG: hypothetical protein EOP37_21075 [Rubrivivax sp.]|nr:MAG: hypothetical protein EOP37_21075 [Rubrivivax sp.]
MQAFRRAASLSASIVCAFAVVACNLHADNSEQKQRTARLIEAMHPALIEPSDPSSAAPVELFALPTYSRACTAAEPRVPQPSCLSVVVLGPTLPAAEQQTRRLAELIEPTLRPGAPHAWAGATVVLFSAVRKDDAASAPVTPYALGNQFKTSGPVIVRFKGNAPAKPPTKSQ